jgi:hypothetical protein
MPSHRSEHPPTRRHHSRRQLRGSTRHLAPIVLLALLASGTAAAQSTTGFKLNLSLESSPAPTLHWLALPYLYSPADVGDPGILDAEDLCQDLGDGITAVLRWNETSSAFQEHPCGDPSPFALDEGVGYGIRLQADRTFAAAITGGHDDGFAYSIAPSGGSQLTWASVPYHIRATDKPLGSLVTAEDLCRQIGDNEVLAILRWNGDLGAYETYGCGSAFQTPFDVVRGESYGLINRPNQTIAWQPVHH